METEKTIRRHGIKVAWLTVICIFAALIFVVMPVLTVIIYNANFGERYETVDWIAYSVSDFEGLQVEECSFPSNNGQILAGYHYSKETEQEIKGVVVLAHGLGGGGHNTYMDIADYFTSCGYLVFAYDATGNDKSEGDSVEGLPQGVIDLDYALRYVKQSDKYQNLPIVLFGHSWGGYSVGNVLNCHPDITAAVVIAGFNRSSDLIESQGKSIVGPAIKLFMPYISLYERIKFGKYSTYSAIDGFAASDAGIMIIHSRDDDVVPIEYGYDTFHSVYGDIPGFQFVECKDKGHNYIYNSDASKICRDRLNEEYFAYVEANGGEYNAEIKTAFMAEHLDKSKCFELDAGLMRGILAFYDSYCTGSKGESL